MSRQNGYWNEDLYPNFPREGWDLIDVEDTGEACHTCEMCTVQHDVRHVHTVRHADQADDLHVGCDCSGIMTGDAKFAKSWEREVKNQTKRRESYLRSKKWRISRNGYLTRTYEGYWITIVDHGNRCGLRVGGGEWSNGHADVTAAKLAAFAMIDGDHGLSPHDLARLSGAWQPTPDGDLTLHYRGIRYSIVRSHHGYHLRIGGSQYQVGTIGSAKKLANKLIGKLLKKQTPGTEAPGAQTTIIEPGSLHISGRPANGR